MGNFISLLVQGISLGLTYFLLATGLTLTMGLMRVVNMSHGALYMIAGFLGITVHNVTGSWTAGVLAGAALAALLGLGMEIGFLRRLYKNPANQVLLTIGFINIIANTAQWIWGGFPLSAPTPAFFLGSVKLGSVATPTFNFFIMGFGILMAFGLWFLQDKTKVGAMVRASMDNPEIASALGMNNKSLFTAVFALGSLIAGLSSMIGGTLTGINMSSGWDILLTSIIVVVVGGTGSIQGALLGGLLIGLVNTFGVVYFPAIASFIKYIVLIIVLLIKPTGLLGKRTNVNRVVEEAQVKPAALKHGNPLLGRAPSTAGAALYRFAPYIIALAVLLVLPLASGSYTVRILSKVLIFALFAMSLDIVMGYTGMRSFGHAAFFGFGGYMTGILSVKLGMTSFWVILPITLLSCAVLSAIIGYFTLRVTGVHFLLVTMAFGQLLSQIATRWHTVTGGSDGFGGIKYPNLGFEISWDPTKFYFFTLIFFIICFLLLNRFMKSSFGRSLIGIRENEGRMRSLGFNAWVIKYFGMILAGVFAGMAGMLYAYLNKAMTPLDLALETSALPMLMVIMGGGATLWGPALGATAIVLVQSYAGIFVPDRWPLVLGILYVVCVMFLQGGFSRYLASFYNWIGGKIFGNTSAAGKVLDDGKANEAS
jgi:branched-chain amino acid transport system permease protein